MKRIILITASIALLMLTAFSIRLFLQMETRSSLALTRFMPGGALAYVEFRDLDSLLNQWMSSAAHKRYLASANWKQFQTSRLYLKLSQRLEPIEAALGFELTEQRLGLMAGTQSALGVYSLGGLEALFVTEMSREQAFGSELFKQRSAFRERSMDGLAYYVRAGTSAEGREKAEAGFAFAQGKLFVASSENLLRRALTNLTRESEDRLSVPMARLAERLNDFEPHDITVWLDQKRLNADRYFRNYWIQRNQPELADIESALVDLEIANDEFRERRWLALSETAPKDQPAISSLNDLLRLAPADTHLLTVASSKDLKTLSRQVADVLLGVIPTPPSPLTAGALPYPDYGLSYGPPPSPSIGTWRYASLDDRFNKDIDDPTSFAGMGPRKMEPPPTVSESKEKFVTRLMSILQPAQPRELMNVGQATVGDNRLFVYFNRALIIRLTRPDALNRPEFEKAVQEEFTARYVVQGVPDRLDWKAVGEVHSLSQALLDRGGAYAILGDYLILANRADYCDRIVRAYHEPNAPAQSQVVALDRFAQVRIQQGKGVYQQVMEMLATPGMTIGSNVSIDLFSDNIASLLDVVPELNSVTIETVHAASFSREVAIYKFTIR